MARSLLLVACLLFAIATGQPLDSELKCEALGNMAPAVPTASPNPVSLIYAPSVGSSGTIFTLGNFPGLSSGGFRRAPNAAGDSAWTPLPTPPSSPSTFLSAALLGDGLTIAAASSGYNAARQIQFSPAGSVVGTAFSNLGNVCSAAVTVVSPYSSPDSLVLYASYSRCPTTATNSYYSYIYNRTADSFSVVSGSYQVNNVMFYHPVHGVV